MLLKIIFGYSSWFILLCLLLASGYAFLLYWRSKPIEKPFHWLNVLLPIVRGTLVFFILFLLLKPLIKYPVFRSEKPIIILALDKSISVTAGKNTLDSVQLTNLAEGAAKKLGENFNVEKVEFGERTNPVPNFSNSFNHTSTNISSILDYNLAQRFRNVAATIVISDGIYNEGINPLNLTDNQKNQIFTVGLGDTSIFRDLMVKQVIHNSIAYLGSQFPVKVEIQAEKLKGESSQLKISKDGVVVFSKPIEINENALYEEFDVLLNADRVGYHRYTVSLNAIEGEKNTDNNVAVFFVEVLDARKKVNIVSDYPHPDIGAITHALNAFDNYDVQVNIGDYKITEKEDLVIFYGAFKNQKDMQFIKLLNDKNIPILQVLDDRFQPNLFNQNIYDINFEAEGSSFISGSPIWNSSFDFFEISEAIQSGINQWSPLNQRYGKFSGFRPEQIVMFQKIGNVLTEQPSILIGKQNNLRFGIIHGNGFWRWRLLTFEKNASHDVHNEFWNKLIQFLTVKQEQKRLKVSPSKRLYTTGENIILNGELLNKNLEAVTSSEIKIKMVQSIDGKEKQFSYVMTAQENNYNLRLSDLEAADYTFVATASIGGETLIDKGAFSVSGVQKELARTVADHTLLKNLALQTGGEFYNSDQINDLIQYLNNRTDFKEIVFQENKMQDLIDWKWLFWLILILLSFEWLMRKLSVGM